MTAPQPLSPWVVVVILSMVVVMALRIVSTLRRGEYRTRFGGITQRSESPVRYWYGFGVDVALLALLVAAFVLDWLRR